MTNITFISSPAASPRARIAGIARTASTLVPIVDRPAVEFSPLLADRLAALTADWPRVRVVIRRVACEHAPQSSPDWEPRGHVRLELVEDGGAGRRLDVEAVDELVRRENALDREARERAAWIGVTV